MSEKVKRTKREIAYKGKILEVYKDHMDIDGTESIWDFIHLKGGAAVIPVMDDGRILLIQQYRNAIDGYSLEIPGGVYDEAGEDGATCALRELKEETGYVAGKLDWILSVHSLIAFSDEKVNIYVAKELCGGTRHLDEEEDIEVVILSLDEIKEKLYSGYITDGKTVAGLWAYISQETNI